MTQNVLIAASAQQDKAPLTMTTREVADLLEKQHSNIKISAERLAASGVIGTLAVQEFIHNGNTYTEYLLNKRDSLILVAQNCPQFTARIVDRWQELEAANAFTLPKTFGEALRLAAEQQEKIEQQQAQLLLAAPKVAYVDTFVDHGANKNTTAVAKDLGVSGKKLGLWLRYNKFAFRQKGKMMWYQSFMDSGYGVHKAFNTKTEDKNGTSGTQALLTPKGDVFVKDKYKSKPEVPDCFEEVEIV